MIGIALGLLRPTAVLKVVDVGQDDWFFATVSELRKIPLAWNYNLSGEDLLVTDHAVFEEIGNAVAP